MTAALRLTGVRAGYGAVEVLHGVDLVVPPGSVVALLGPNGAGKTTLMGAVAGTVPLRAGEVAVGGSSLAGRSVFERARDGLCLVPEQRGIFPGLAVADNLTVFARSAGVSAVQRAEALARVHEVFPVLRQRRAQLAGTLSGGEQQMLALSRAVLRRPDVLLLDEISLGLAPLVVDELFEVVARLAAGAAATVVVEQYVDRVLRLADTVYVLRRGEVAFVGEPAELRGRSDLVA